MPYISLHNHSNYSFLDGLSTIEGMITKAKKLGQNSIALTDHGVLCGIIPFYKECRKQGIKPILGMESYFCKDKDQRGSHRQVNSHLLILAQTTQGYHNLIKLASDAYLQNFYYKPRVTIELLDKYKEGLWISSACLQSPFRKAWMPEQTEANNPWTDSIEQLLEIFKNKISFEVQPYESQDQALYNSILRKEAYKRKIPIIISTDAHYINKEDYNTHDSLLAIQTGTFKDSEMRMKHLSNTLYLHSEQELIERGFPEEEISNTQYIADSCEVNIDFSTKFPKQPNALQRIIAQCESELRRGKYSSVYRKRIEHEISVIRECKFADYFLILSEIIRWAKKNKIRIGAARGSSAASLVCKFLGITEVDPIKHDLLFERFLNADRIGLPDVDTDVEDQRRDEVIDHIIEKFGRNNASSICTIHRAGVRQAFKDLARTYKIPFEDSNKISKLISPTAQSFEEAMAESAVLRRTIEESGVPKELLNQVDSLRGTPRQPGTHAAAMVVSPDKITNHIPLMKIKEDIVTMYDMRDIEDVGLVKFDILGLKNLSVIENTIKLVTRRHTKVSRETIELLMNQLNDEKVFSMIASGNTLGCFQIETPAISNLCKRMPVKNFEDIVHVISLNRPGVTDTGMLEEYFTNRHGKNKIKYVHNALSSLLEDTYGIMMHQEQMMQASIKLASFTPGESDTLRKGIAKKHPEILLKLKSKFIDGCIKNGYKLKEAEFIFDIFEKSGRYLFNKSHGVAYSYTTYYTAWLKYHYPLEFMISLLNSEKDESSLAEYFTEALRMNIKIKSLDVNKSIFSHKIDQNCIRPGMKIIKGMGANAAISIVRERNKHGRFESFEDFLSRINPSTVTIKAIRGMIETGCFDNLNYQRQDLIASEDEITLALNKIRKLRAKAKKNKDQLTLFKLDKTLKIELHIEKTDTPNTSFLRNLERENLGFYINNPLNEFNDWIRFNTHYSWDKIEEDKSLGSLKIAGIVEGFKSFPMKDYKSGKFSRGAFFTLNGIEEKFRCVIFSNDYYRCEHLLSNGSVVLVTGKYNLYKDERGLIVNNIIELTQEMII